MSSLASALAEYPTVSVKPKPGYFASIVSVYRLRASSVSCADPSVASSNAAHAVSKYYCCLLISEIGRAHV